MYGEGLGVYCKKKWKKLNSDFEEKASFAKERYYENIVQDLKESNPGQWHSKVKRMACNDPSKSEKIIIQDLADKPSEKLISDQFANISLEHFCGIC